MQPGELVKALADLNAAVITWFSHFFCAQSTLSSLPFLKFTSFSLRAHIFVKLFCEYFFEMCLFLSFVDCSSHSVGIPSSSLLPDHRFTATSFYDDNYLPDMGRLGSNEAWLLKNQNENDYLQIDLGDMFYICAIATQGYSRGEYVTMYKVLFSKDNQSWTTYSENGTSKV